MLTAFKESLVAEVEMLIKRGWQPFRGIQIQDKTGWMYQVMVKYED